MFYNFYIFHSARVVVLVTCFGFRVAAFTLDCPARLGFFFARDEIQRNAFVELRLGSNVVCTKAADTHTLASELSTTPQKRSASRENRKFFFERSSLQQCLDP